MNRMDTDSWMHTQPMPMPGSPVVVLSSTQSIICKLPATTDLSLVRFRPSYWDWSFLASVRQGVPPEGIMAEFTAWERQYPTAWLAVDLCRGVIPPSTQMPLDDLLSGMKRNVIIIVMMLKNILNGLLESSFKSEVQGVGFPMVPIHISER